MTESFTEFLKNNIRAKEMFKSLNIQPLSKQEIEECIQRVPIKIEYDIADIILSRQNLLWEQYYQIG